MKNLKRILELIRKTGDRYIFEDEQGNIFVIAGVDDYENLVLKNNNIKNLSEEELLNKINKDIAIWQASKEKDSLPETWDELKDKIEAVEEDRYYFEPAEDED